MRKTSQLATLAALCCTLCACGGGGAAATPAPAPAPATAPAVSGISTPSSVSVVTAKNAN